MKYAKLLLLALMVALSAGCSTVKYGVFTRLPADLPQYRWMLVEQEVVLVNRNTGLAANVTKTELKRARELQYAALKVYADRIYKERVK